jgi:hypothetical protein
MNLYGILNTIHLSTPTESPSSFKTSQVTRQKLCKNLQEQVLLILLD